MTDHLHGPEATALRAKQRCSLRARTICAGVIRFSCALIVAASLCAVGCSPEPDAGAPAPTAAESAPSGSAPLETAAPGDGAPYEMAAPEDPAPAAAAPPDAPMAPETTSADPSAAAPSFALPSPALASPRKTAPKMSEPRIPEPTFAPAPVESEPLMADDVPRGLDSNPSGGATPESYDPSAYGPPPTEEAGELTGEGDLPEPFAVEFTPEDQPQLVKVYYATDRAPEETSAKDAGWLRFYAPALVTALISMGLLAAWRFARHPNLTAVLAALGILGTLYLAQTGTVRRQQTLRTLSYGDRSYGSARHERGGAPVLELGVCEVSIPPDHRTGVVESPSVFRLEFVEDPQKHVVLKRVVHQPDDAFYADLKETIDDSVEGQAFVFIHGYNVGFPSAVKRTAQIAIDLKFKGAAICYSWPSYGGLASYTGDEANVNWTVVQLERFLQDVAARTQVRTMHLIAHSMGNRALTQALERLALRAETDIPLAQVILAAPDVDSGEFRTRFAPALMKLARRVTLYDSSNDRALVASTKVHGYTRAGLSGPHLTVVPGLDTVDVSPIDTSLIGHSYYGDNPLMIRDLGALMGRDAPAAARIWLRQSLSNDEFQYWVFRTDTPVELMPPEFEHIAKEPRIRTQTAGQPVFDGLLQRR